jgi:hypothetical protein
MPPSEVHVALNDVIAPVVVRHAKLTSMLLRARPT